MTTQVVVPAQSSRRAATPEEVARQKGLTYIPGKGIQKGQTAGFQETINQQTKLEELKGAIRQGAINQANSQAGTNKVADVKTQIEALKEVNQKIAEAEKSASDKYDALIQLQQQQQSSQPSQMREVFLKQDQPRNIDVSSLPDDIRYVREQNLIDRANQNISERQAAMETRYINLMNLKQSYSEDYYKKPPKTPKPPNFREFNNKGQQTVSTEVVQAVGETPESSLLIRPELKTKYKVLDLIPETFIGSKGIILNPSIRRMRERAQEIEREEKSFIKDFYGVNYKYNPDSPDKLTVSGKPDINVALNLVNQGISKQNIDSSLKAIGEYQAYSSPRNKITMVNTSEQNDLDLAYKNLQDKTNAYLLKENIKTGAMVGVIAGSPAIIGAVAGSPVVGSVLKAATPVLNTLYGISLIRRGKEVGSNVIEGRPLAALMETGGIAAEVGTIYIVNRVVSGSRDVKKVLDLATKDTKRFQFDVAYGTKTMDATEYMNEVVLNKPSTGKDTTTINRAKYILSQTTRKIPVADTLTGYSETPNSRSVLVQNLKTYEQDILTTVEYKGKLYLVNTNIKPDGTSTIKVIQGNKILHTYKTSFDYKDIFNPELDFKDIEVVETRPDRTTIRRKSFGESQTISKGSKYVPYGDSVTKTDGDIPFYEGSTKTVSLEKIDITPRNPAKSVSVDKPQYDLETGVFSPGGKTTYKYQTEFVPVSERGQELNVFKVETPKTIDTTYPTQTNIRDNVIQITQGEIIMKGRKPTFFEKIVETTKSLASNKRGSASLPSTKIKQQEVLIPDAKFNYEQSPTYRLYQPSTEVAGVSSGTRIITIPLPGMIKNAVLSQGVIIGSTSKVADVQKPEMITGSKSASDILKKQEAVVSQSPSQDLFDIQRTYQGSERYTDTLPVSGITQLPINKIETGIRQEQQIDQITSPEVTTIQKSVFEFPNPPEPPRRIERYPPPPDQVIVPRIPKIPKVNTGDSALEPGEESRKVKVRRKGKFITVGVISGEAQAIEFGKEIVGRTSAATFSIEPTKQKGKRYIGKSNVAVVEKKKIGESRVFTQPRSTRISSIGEKAEITYKGIAASRSSRKTKAAFSGRSKIRI